ncbi:MAG: family 10 glycosylhydrolase [Proteobacteria bacterium]|nr:family 10 glycosylhydrolase [Pseudomonadota bacterium]
MFTLHPPFSRPAHGLAVVVALVCLGCGSEPEPASPTGSPEQASQPAPEPAPERRRALWVLCEGSQRVLEDSTKVLRLVEDAEALGATDLFVQVYRGGRAWYDATLADPEPYQQLLAATGQDTLRLLLQEAHAAGIAVHAWVNVLSLAGNRNAPIVRDLGRSSVLVDRHGRSLLDYPGLEVPPPQAGHYRMGTRGVYLDAGAPGVRDRIVATYRELLERYPELDGLHLDYIRHPDVLPFIPGSGFGVGLDFGYGAETRERFRQETGNQAPFQGRGGAHRGWDAWQRDQVTELVAAIAAAARGVRPALQMSAAVASHADRAYLSLAQDWRSWLDAGSLDFAVVMAYTLDDRMLDYHVDAFTRSKWGDRTWIGTGTWLFAKRPQRALDQLALVRASTAPGEALFSYDSIVDAPALLSALQQEAARESAGAP